LSTLGDVILRDVTSARPAASISGRLFFATDTGKQWRDNGTSWQDVTGKPNWGDIGGSLASQADLTAALTAKLDDSQLDVDGTLAANSDAKIASQKATKTYVDAKVAAGGGTAAVGIVIDGGGSAPATGSKGYVQVPYNATITGWTMLANVSGSAQITVKKSTYSGFPTTSSIVASAPPAISSAQNATSTTLTGWTTSLTLGDVLEFNLDSVTTITRLILQLQVTR